MLKTYHSVLGNSICVCAPVCGAKYDSRIINEYDFVKCYLRIYQNFGRIECIWDGVTHRRENVNTNCDRCG